MKRKKDIMCDDPFATLPGSMFKVPLVHNCLYEKNP